LGSNNIANNLLVCSRQSTLGIDHQKGNRFVASQFQKYQQCRYQQKHTYKLQSVELYIHPNESLPRGPIYLLIIIFWWELVKF